MYCIFYFVYGLSDFMQLVDSAFTACMQHTGFTTGTLCIVFSILCMDSDFMQLVDSTFTMCMQCTLCIVYFVCVQTLGFYAASG